MVKRKISICCFVIAFLFSFLQIAMAGIKISNDDCPVFIASHTMGGQVVQYPNGSYSMMGLITGFSSDKFPLNATFKTSTNFISTARYQPVVSAIVLTDRSGKTTMSRFEFEMKFDRPGSMFTELVDWKISFPSEGFYAFNVFVDGTLVGYYPFYVWSR